MAEMPRDRNQGQTSETGKESHSACCFHVLHSVKAALEFYSFKFTPFNYSSYQEKKDENK